jgi:hypothetical protein
VRNAVVWCGLPDPCETRTALREDGGNDRESMAALLRVMGEMDPAGRGLTAVEVVRYHDSPPTPLLHWYTTLQAALGELLPAVTAHSLGCLLRSARRRNFGGRFIDHAGPKGECGIKWVVRLAGELKRGPAPVAGDAAVERPAGSRERPPATDLLGQGGFLPD